MFSLSSARRLFQTQMSGYTHHLPHFQPRRDRFWHLPSKRVTLRPENQITVQTQGENFSFNGPIRARISKRSFSRAETVSKSPFSFLV
jgi:hypothetical protein